MDVDSPLTGEMNETPFIRPINDTPSVEEANANNGYKEYENEIDTSDEEVSPFLHYLF